jgi:hypothetical protein
MKKPARRKHRPSTISEAERRALLARDWWPATTAALYLSCGAKFIYAQCQAGRLRHFKLGGSRSLRTCKAWCDAFLERDAAGGHEPPSRVAVPIAEVTRRGIA